jgi:hypothetical protein
MRKMCETLPFLRSKSPNFHRPVGEEFRKPNAQIVQSPVLPAHLHRLGACAAKVVMLADGVEVDGWAVSRNGGDNAGEVRGGEEFC